MIRPKISIVTPSYNQGQYLEQTILSVLGQRYPNLEYLIYDAASTDDSVAIIKKYEKELTFWISEKDNGQADAINKGFKKATGEILMWLNSDDILMPNILNYIAAQYIEKGDGIYYGNCIHFEEQHSGALVTRGSDTRITFNKVALELADTIIQPSTFWSRNVWIKNGELNDTFHYGFDWEWFLRARKNNIPFYPISRPISMYRIHDEHKSSTGGIKRQNELLEIYKIYSPFYGELFNMLKEENIKLTVFENIVFKVIKLIYGRGVNEIHFLKLKKYKKYKKFRAKEMEIILTML